MTTPTAIHRRPMCFAPGEKSQGEEMSATFLDVRGRPCALLIVLVGVGAPGEPEKKKSKRQELSGSGSPETWSGRVRFFTSLACFRFVFDDFGTLLWIWAILGARRAAGGAPRREMTRKRQPKAQKCAPCWDAFGSWKHYFSACVFLCFFLVFFL